MYLQDEGHNPLEVNDTHGKIWDRADVSCRIVVVVDILVLHLTLLYYIKRIRTGDGANKKQ